MQIKVEEEILKTIVYFDLFYYPLTILEIYQNISVKTSYSNIYEALNKSDYFSKRLITKNGMWMLKDKPDAVAKRQERYRVSKGKINKARNFANKIKWIPWIKDIFVCNSLGYLNSNMESDIDFFIVVKKGRIWASRFFSVLLASLFGKRPSKECNQDTLCLSFFAVDGVDMKRASIDNDIYYQSWMTKIMPIVAREMSWQKLLERNRWVKVAFPQAKPIQIPRALIYTKRKGSKRLWFFGNAIEHILKRLQLRIMPESLKKVANQGTSVILTNDFLKFHDNDKREQIKKEFSERLAKAMAW